MKINTAYFGSQEIDQASIITFPRGLVGFEEATRFKLFHEADEPTIFYLQSIDRPDLAFSVVRPEVFNCFFELVLDDDESRLLELEEPVEAEVLLMLSKAEEGEEVEDRATGAKINANLKGPLIINLRSRKGLQKVVKRITHATLLRAE